MYYILCMDFGEYVRETRERFKEQDKKFSVRQVAMRVGIEPAYLSKIERGQFPPPSEETTRRLAAELDLDSDILLAMGGKVSKDLQEVILKRPRLFADLIRELKGAPNKAILRIVREVRDGDW
ncbi:MAG: helix-turn-helix transcriptional regulator [Desulfatiglandales bacterium]|nr:helix-turn-helix transcriptional regulator [Desulfatiglandales bacterium]